MESSAFDRLAQAELRRSRHELLFADLQACRRGEYEEVARRIRKRKYRTLVLCGVILTAYHLIPGESGSFGSFLWILCGMRMLQEYVDARHAEETIRRLREERDRVGAGA